MTKNVETLWRQMAEILQTRLDPDIYSNWISVIKAKAMEGDTIVLSVSNDFYLWWIQEHFLQMIGEAAELICEKKTEVRVDVDTSLAKPVAASQATPPTLKKQVRKSHHYSGSAGTVLNPDYIFDSFVVGPSNNHPHATSLAVAQAPGRAYNPLFIYGGVSLGKTHLMQAIGHYILSHSKLSVCYVSCETMMNEYINSLQQKNTDAFRKKYRATDVLLVDDIHFLANKDGLQEEFHHTFNQLFNARKQIVMTSDRAASEISGLEKRLVSRFEWGLVADICPPSFETRVAILRSKQQRLKLPLPDEVITFIASHIRSNIRKLEGALTRITSFASIYGKPITLDLVEEQLQNFLEQEKGESATIPAIQKKVADHFDIRVSDITGIHRNQSFAVPRQIAMYLCRTMTDSSYPEIGAAFDKTHATVLHAHRVVQKKRVTDPQMDKLLTTLIKQINPDGMQE